MAKLTTLISSTTSATQSEQSEVQENSVVTIQLTGTWGASENADIQVIDDSGTWSDLYENGAQSRLNNTNTATHLTGPLVFRIDKDATSASAGVIMVVR